jgi:predicted DNA-binding WGR domain protein
MKGHLLFMHRSALHEPQNPKTQRSDKMQTERAELYFRQGSSDKVYHLQLENTQERWSVQAQWGRRGSALQSDIKVSDTTYEDAKRAYDRLLREKTGKGYQIAQATTNGDTPISVGLPACNEHSGHIPELLTPVEEPEALRLAEDVSWWFQQKFDGRRLAVQKADGKYSGINKLGQIVPIDSRLTEPLDLVQAKAFSPMAKSPIPFFRLGLAQPERYRPSHPTLRNPLRAPDAAFSRCTPNPSRLRNGHDTKSETRLREGDARRERGGFRLQEQVRHLRWWTSRTALQMQICRYRILCCRPETRQEGG